MSSTVTSHIGTSRRWVFTLNNPKGLIDEDELKSWGATYLVYQEEVGESGTHHFQGYIEMPKSVRCTHFMPGLRGGHFERAKGTPEQCKAYCTKAETRVGGPYEFGKVIYEPAVGLRYASIYDDDLLTDSDEDNTCISVTKYAIYEY